MKKTRFTPLLALLLAGAAPAWAAAPAVDSLYTGLAEADCRLLEQSDEGAGWSMSRCPGVAGYALSLEEGDLRQTLAVLTPDGAKQPLRFGEVVSGGFSYLGPKAEWRVRKVDGGWRPFALIVRLNASEDSADATLITSYLVVSKITPQGSCVTDVVPPQGDANQHARDQADNAADRPCKAAPH